MPIAPITGTLKRRIILDLSTALTLGLIGGYGWWYGFHKPYVAKRDAWYTAQANKEAEE